MFETNVSNSLNLHTLYTLTFHKSNYHYLVYFSLKRDWIIKNWWFYYMKKCTFYWALALQNRYGGKKINFNFWKGCGRRRLYQLEIILQSFEGGIGWEILNHIWNSI